jgi:hypothetical protein
MELFFLIWLRLLWFFFLACSLSPTYAVPMILWVLRREISSSCRVLWTVLLALW